MQNDMCNIMSDKDDSFSDDSLMRASSDSTEIDSLEMDPFGIMEGMSEAMEEAFYISDFTKTWIVRFGYIGLFLSLLYVLGGVFLLIPKKHSINLAYLALVLSFVFSILTYVVITSDAKNSFVGMATGFTQIGGIIIDFILLIVIIASDKTAYENKVDKAIDSVNSSQ